jgi:ketosteroid isomerase-like protein
MDAVDNKRLMQDAFSEMSKGNDKLFIDALSDDVSWTWMGTVNWTKTFEGKESVVNDLLGPARGMLAGPSTATVHRLIADDDHVVVEFQGHSTLVDGRPYNNKYCWVCTFADGKVQELDEFMDTELVTETFGTIDK